MQKKAEEDVSAAKTVATGVEVVFDVPGTPSSPVSVTFTRKPVGFDFHHQAPITVDQVAAGSHAEELGVKKGFVVRSIHGQDVGVMGFEEKYEMFVAALSSLPGGVEIVFGLPDGVERVIQFRKRNLGFDFQAVTPIKVDTVFPNSHAASLGVEPGWVIKQINGEDMSAPQFENYDMKFDHLRKSLSSLPNLDS